jgi:hypothetical protein
MCTNFPVHSVVILWGVLSYFFSISGSTSPMVCAKNIEKWWFWWVLAQTKNTGNAYAGTAWVIAWPVFFVYRETHQKLVLP